MKKDIYEGFIRTKGQMLVDEDDKPYFYKQSGWDWIDKNIEWAKKYGIRLILNMHYPQGGFQSNGNGTALWTVRENQERLTALWKEIALRYKDEPVVIGYDFINEPIVPKMATVEESFAQWVDLAERRATCYFFEKSNQKAILAALNLRKHNIYLPMTVIFGSFSFKEKECSVFLIFIIKCLTRDIVHNPLFRKDNLFRFAQ